MRPTDTPQIAQQRAGARRTALVVACVAIAIYVAFVLSGVIGR